MKYEDIKIGIWHNCLMFTIMITLVSLNKGFIKQQPIYIGLPILIIILLGSMMIYIPIGVKLEEIRRKLGRKVKW